MNLKQTFLIALLAAGLTQARAAVPGPATTNDLFDAHPTGPSVSLVAVTPVTMGRGKSAPVELTFRIANRFHINSNRPNSDYMIPTALRLDPPSDIMVGRFSYPVGEKLVVDFMPNEPLSVYSGQFSVRGLVTTVRNVAPGTYRVHGALKFQACDNRQCFPPKETPVAFDVRVVRGGGGASAGRNPGQSPHVRQTQPKVHPAETE